MYSNLKGKRIVYGITGSIAAYKSPLIVRELVKAGADVKVIMTPSAQNFVTPMVLENLSRQKVLIDMFDISAQSGGALHIEAAHQCDLMLIAPCSATTLGKLANAICDNALVSISTALPREIPFVVAPAMDSTMWMHPATQRSYRQIQEDGAIVIPPVEGPLSSGLYGPGRFPEISDVVKFIDDVLGKKTVPKSKTISKEREKELTEKPLETVEETVDKVKFNTELEFEDLKIRQTLTHLKGKNILVNAGPTHERIDAVRYISNYSTGKMGFAIAEAANQAGANVTLVTGPVNLTCSPEIRRIDVVTAYDMYDICIQEFPKNEIAILSAAVADFRPDKYIPGKIKKEQAGNEMQISLTKTKDILKELGNMKRAGQFVVGFALESENEVEYGREKLKAKNSDMIVVNKAGIKNSGFGGDKNTITILKTDGLERTFDAMSKRMCAIEMLRLVK